MVSATSGKLSLPAPKGPTPAQEVSITAEAGCNGHSNWSKGFSTAKSAKAEHQTRERIHSTGKLQLSSRWTRTVLSCFSGCCAGHAPAKSAEEQLEEIIATLRDGSVGSRSAAAEELYNKAAGDETARQRAVSLEVVPSLVRLLYDGEERGRMYAAYAVSSGVIPGQLRADERSAGVIPALVAVLETSNVLATKSTAVHALCHLARFNEAAVEIVVADAVPELVALLDCENPGLVKRCLTVLHYIGSYKERLKSVLTQLGAVAPVVRLCSSSQPEIQAAAVGVINVLSGHAEASSAIANSGGLEVLAAVATQGSSQNAMSSAIKAIQRLDQAPWIGARVRESAAGPLLTDSTCSPALSRSPMDEVAVKAIKADYPPLEETSLRYKELRKLPHPDRVDFHICRNSDGSKRWMGAGDSGVVYKALVNGIDEVAVKIVMADWRTQAAMSHIDVRVLRWLRHRNIVQFYGANLELGNMFFVTELMRGGNLYLALRYRPDTMQWDCLGKKVALDIALGLKYLHTRKPPMVHFDLKSSHVLLSEECKAKIANFGMGCGRAKEMDAAQPVMTQLWAAPEVMRRERGSPKSDIWSYGVLIWELVSGQDIVWMHPPAITRRMHAPGNDKAMEQMLPPDCPSIARTLFEACTQMDPDNRPTASQIVEWLRNPRAAA